MKNASCIHNAPTRCCIGGSPPSPDGDHPRLPSHSRVPVDGLRLMGRFAFKDHIPTWRMVEGTELQAIAEDPVDDGADYVKSVRHRGTAEYREMLGVDDFSDSDKEFVRIKPKKSSSTLKSVSRKLKKHLSHSSVLKKRHSRASIGTSEEEIERRAELRRIRQRRIQHELALEEGHGEDDAKSASSIIKSPPPTTAGKEHSSWKPGTLIPFPLLTPPPLQSPRLPIPHPSPIDKQSNVVTEGCLTEGSTSGLTPRRWSDPELSVKLSTPDNFHRTLSRPYSSPFFVDWHKITTEPQLYVPTRHSSTTLVMPPQPALHARRLPSIALPARSSWRLSFTGDDRADSLRKISHGPAVPVTLDAGLLKSKSPRLNRGLHDAGFRLSSQVILSSDDNSHLDSLASHVKTCSADQAFGGVDGSSMTQNRGTIISQKLVSRALRGSSSSPQLSSNSYRGHIFKLNDSSQVHAEGPRIMAETTDSELSKLIPQSWGQVVPSQGSSVYHSIGNSSQESRQSSRFNLLSLLSASKSKISAAEYQELIPSQISLLGSPANNSSPSLTIPSARNTHGSNIDDSSLLASETSSFREREVELNAVQTRFAFAEARRVQGSPVSSKFREEFCSEIEEPPVHQQRRPSAFSKLSRFAVRGYDGAELEELLDVPGPKFGSQHLKTPGSRTPGRLSLSTQEDAASVNLWRKSLGSREDRSRGPESQSNGMSLGYPKDAASVNLWGMARKSEEDRSREGTTLEELLNVPLPDFDPQELKITRSQSTGFLSPFGSQMDAASINLWAFPRRSEGSQSREGSDNFHNALPRRRSSLAPREKSALEEELPVSVLGNLTKFGKKKKKPTLEVGHSTAAAEAYNERFAERLAAKELVMDSWEEEMAANELKAQARSRNIIKRGKPAGPDRRYPATWARFPSHTRSQRSASAGRSNNVEVRDFAVLGRDGEDIVWCLEHDDSGHHTEIKTPTRKGFGHKIKERVSYEAYKLNTAHRQAFETRGRRGSLTVSNELEYPELELLPVTLLTAEQMKARDEEVAAAEEERAKEEELHALIALFGRDGASDEADALFTSHNVKTIHGIEDRSDNTAVHQKAKLSVEGELDAHQTPGATSGKFKTWNGNDFDGYWYEGKIISPDTNLFEKSAQHLPGGEDVDLFEAEDILKAVTDAWLRGSEYATD